MTTTYKLHAVIKVKGDGKGRTEEAYTYVSEDEQKGVQFRFHSTKAWAGVVLNRHNVSPKEITDIFDAFVCAGMDQRKFAGGFDEAIKIIQV